MSLTNNLQNLKQKDVFNIMLFVLYKLKDIPDYKVLSELSYLVDKESLLNICQYYGGMTIRIPTVDELNNVLTALTLYLKVDIQHLNFENSLNKFELNKEEKQQLINTYIILKDTLMNYRFNV